MICMNTYDITRVICVYPLHCWHGHTCPALWTIHYAWPMALPLQIIMIMHELQNELKTSVHWACRYPHAAAIWQSNHGRRSHLYETKGTWKNYPTCFALLNVGFMIVLRRAGRYVLIWARRAVPTNLQLSSFQTLQLLEQNLKNYFSAIVLCQCCSRNDDCEAVW